MFSALEIAIWFLLKNNAEVREHEAINDDYEVYEGITHLKLQKLLYYAQGISLGMYGKPLFLEKIEGLDYRSGYVLKVPENVNFEKKGVFEYTDEYGVKRKILHLAIVKDSKKQ